MPWNVTVNVDLCTGDGECADVCPLGVYKIINKKAVPINAGKCIGCKDCVQVCETCAITVKEVRAKKLKKS